MKSYELPLSPNYVCNWGIKEAIRELLQNAIDGKNCGHEMSIKYDCQTMTLQIVNKNMKLPKSSLVLGCSSKSDIDGMIGQFGEGYKLALVVLLRKGYDVSIINADEIWIPSFKVSENFNTQVLTINVEQNDDTEIDLNFIIKGINQELYEELCLYFPCINNNYGEIIKSDNGDILLDKRFSGKMYVEGLYIQSDNNFEYGYNFNADVVELDRDRKAINYYDLRKLTASSVVTSEGCAPELFKAISRSCVDVRDIEEVIEDASTEFLEEYRDMLYEKMGLEENTLIATESVMKQLEQMDIDVPVAKGSEIESYLVAKANDKLGIIYEAKEQVQKRDEEVDAWDYIMDSHWFKIKCWINKYKDEVAKIAIDDLEHIIFTWKPSSLYYIEKYIPEDFEWSEENFEELKEQTKNQT